MTNRFEEWKVVGRQHNWKVCLTSDTSKLTRNFASFIISVGQYDLKTYQPLKHMCYNAMLFPQQQILNPPKYWQKSLWETINQNLQRHNWFCDNVFRYICVSLSDLYIHDFYLSVSWKPTQIPSPLSQVSMVAAIWQIGWVTRRKPESRS